MVAKKVRFRALDVVIILLCLVVGVYVYYRIAYGLEYKGDWSAIPQFLIRREASDLL